MKLILLWAAPGSCLRTHMYELRGNEYVEIPASRAFPLAAHVPAGFIELRRTRRQEAAMAAYRSWLKKKQCVN